MGCIEPWKVYSLLLDGAGAGREFAQDTCKVKVNRIEEAEEEEEDKGDLSAHHGGAGTYLSLAIQNTLVLLCLLVVHAVVIDVPLARGSSNTSLHDSSLANRRQDWSFLSLQERHLLGITWPWQNWGSGCFG